MRGALREINSKLVMGPSQSWGTETEKFEAAMLVLMPWALQVDGTCPAFPQHWGQVQVVTCWENHPA